MSTEAKLQEEREIVVFVFCPASLPSQRTSLIEGVKGWDGVLACEPVKANSRVDWVRRAVIVRCEKREILVGTKKYAVSEFLINQLEIQPVVSQAFLHVSEPLVETTGKPAKRRQGG